jgi:hypothetical protein
MKMPRKVDKSPFLRQTWALLKRNAVLHVNIPFKALLIAESMDHVDFFADHFDAGDFVYSRFGYVDLVFSFCLFFQRRIFRRK